MGALYFLCISTDINMPSVALHPPVRYPNRARICKALKCKMVLRFDPLFTSGWLRGAFIIDKFNNITLPNNILDRQNRFGYRETYIRKKRTLELRILLLF